MSDMPMISVITCALPRGTEWLSEAWRSLEDQTLPPDWQWEWLLQIDGPEKLRSSVPQDDPRIRITRNPRNFGAATARTLALGRAGGELVAVLDADDIMLPGHLSRAIAVMETHGAEWTASSALDMHPQGTRVAFETGLSEGMIPNGAFHTYWQDRGIPPVCPATMVARRELVLSVGGWTAFPLAADTGLLLAMEAVAPGYYLEKPGLLYRKWPDQITVSSMSRNEEQRALRNQVIDARVKALRGWGVRWSAA